VVVGWWQGAAGELAGATGRAPDKAVGGRAHPSDGAAWRRRRSMMVRQLRWPMVMEARPCSVGTEEGR
jgi:hypothetical protein